MERREGSLNSIGARVRETLLADPHGTEEIRLGREQFLEEVGRRNAATTRRHSSPSTGRRWLALVFASSFAAGAAGLWMWMRPVSFQVGETRPGQLGDVIESLDGRTTPLHFSEGSTVVLHGGARMRVLALATGAARVLVESGIVDATIAHRKTGKTRWDFEAGPFRVTVTGTKFRMAYYPIEQSFSLATEEGQVVVSGGCQKTATTVSAGEKLELSCLPKEAPAPWSGATAEPQAPAASTDAVAPAGRSPQGESWRELLAAGRLAEGLRAAERGNFDRVCQLSTTKELLALADAARLSGRNARAVTALRTLRRRFPGSMAGSTAAFMLGRMAFERQQAYVEAATWFETYLREQPSGPLMGDSFGRLMEARLRSGDRGAARVNAQQYLRRFPEGPYASEARGILSR
jgi:transmembrane sensor